MRPQQGKPRPLLHGAQGAGPDDPFLRLARHTAGALAISLCHFPSPAEMATSSWTRISAAKQTFAHKCPSQSQPHLQHFFFLPRLCRLIPNEDRKRSPERCKNLPETCAHLTASGLDFCPPGTCVSPSQARTDLQDAEHPGSSSRPPTHSPRRLRKGRGGAWRLEGLAAL